MSLSPNNELLCPHGHGIEIFGHAQLQNSTIPHRIFNFGG